MAENTDATTDELEITATVDVDSVVFALKMNATHGADDRVIAVPQQKDAEAQIRRAFRGSERYATPDNAPVHIRPETLVEDAWTQPPTRAQIDEHALEDPDDEDERDAAYDDVVEVWEQDVRGMITGEHSVETSAVTVTLTGVEDE